MQPALPVAAPRSKKRKQLRMYWIKKLLLTHLLLPPRYNFYKRKSENNTSVQLARPQVHVAPHILG